MSEKEIQQLIVLFCDKSENIFRLAQKKILVNMNVFLPFINRLQINENTIIAKRAEDTLLIYSYNQLIVNYKKAFLQENYSDLLLIYEKLFNINANEYLLKKFLNTFILELKEELAKKNINDFSSDFLIIFSHIIKKHFNNFLDTEDFLIERNIPKSQKISLGEKKPFFFDHNGNFSIDCHHSNPFSISNCIEKSVISNNVFLILFFYSIIALNFKKNNFALAINSKNCSDFLLLMKINNENEDIFNNYNSFLSNIDTKESIDEIIKYRKSLLNNIDKNVRLCNLRKLFISQNNFLEKNNIDFHLLIDECFLSYAEFFKNYLFFARFDYEINNNFFDEKNIIFKAYYKIQEISKNIEQFNKK